MEHSLCFFVYLIVDDSFVLFSFNTIAGKFENITRFKHFLYLLCRWFRFVSIPKGVVAIAQNLFDQLWINICLPNSFATKSLFFTHYFEQRSLAVKS